MFAAIIFKKRETQNVEIIDILEISINISRFFAKHHYQEPFYSIRSEDM